jgi:hypothetical protein
VNENRVLRIIFGPRRNGVTVCWRRLHNEELEAPHFSPITIIRITLRMTKLARHVTRMVRKRKHIGCWWESQRERGH